MIRKGHDTRVETKTNMRGGDGEITIRHLLNEADFDGRGRLFAHMTIRPGCSIGLHEHTGETEVFYVADGCGVLNDDGEEYPVAVGDVIVTKSGHSHSVKCTGSGSLELVALIFFT